MSMLQLPALDGTNPQAWLAALGVLVALDATRDTTERLPRLGWSYQGRWQPTITADLDQDGLIGRILRDRDQVMQDPAFLGLRYKKDGKGPIQRDLKPPPGFFGEYLRGLVRGKASSTSLRMAASFATDVAVDKGKGNTKPTAFHFTAGQQQFLVIADQIAETLTADDVRRALLTGWTYERCSKTFGWDASSYRDYALRADDPGTASKGTVPGADWLAFRGLAFLSCAPIGDRVVTALCHGSGNRMLMRWPLWEPACTHHEVLSLVSLDRLGNLSVRERGARGISMVLESVIVRSDQGYGSFAPPDLVHPQEG
jgi:hypothetical protein